MAIHTEQINWSDKFPEYNTRISYIGDYVKIINSMPEYFASWKLI